MPILIKSVRFWVIAISIFTVSSCWWNNTSTTPTVTPTPTATQPSTPTPAPVIRVVPSGVLLESTELFVEVHQQDNCDVPTTVTSIFANSETIHYIVELGVGVAVNGEGEISIPGFTKVGIGAAVAAHYNVQYGGSETKTFSLALQAPSDTRVDHTLHHLQLWDTGTIIITVLGEDLRIPYRFPRGYRIEKKSIELECPTTPMPSARPTPTPEIFTNIPVQESNLCPDTVTRNKIQEWSLGKTTKDKVQSFITEFNNNRKLGGNFNEGTPIPSGVIIATDFGDGESEKYKALPVRPIIHYLSWGLFETIDTFIAPHAGACISIDTSTSPPINATSIPSPTSISSSSDTRDIAAKTLNYENLNDFMAAFEIPPEIKLRIFVCPNEETWCLGVYEEPGQADFHFKNITKCELDGKQANGTSTIPAGFDGIVKGFTVRPCSR